MSVLVRPARYEVQISPLAIIRSSETFDLVREYVRISPPCPFYVHNSVWNSSLICNFRLRPFARTYGCTCPPCPLWSPHKSARNNSLVRSVCLSPPVRECVRICPSCPFYVHITPFGIVCLSATSAKCCLPVVMSVFTRPVRYETHISPLAIFRSSETTVLVRLPAFMSI